MVAGVTHRIATRAAEDWGAEQSRSLAALIDAGLAPLQAVEVLRQQYPEFGWPLSMLARRLKQGQPLWGALQSSTLYGPRALVLLRAAEEAGKLSDALRQIAGESERQKRRLAALRVQLWLPLGLLLVASLADIFVLLYRREQTAAPSLFDVMLVPGVVWLATLLLLRLLRRDSSFWLGWGWRIGLAPVPFYQRFYDHELLRQLHWPLEAGMPGALIPAQGLLDVADYRRRIGGAQQMLAAGSGLAETLVHHGLILGATPRQLLVTAERAGRLPEAIGHQLGLETGRLASTLDSLYQWLPRLYYLFVLSLVLGPFIR